MAHRLLLWDVDGTLVRVGDIGAAVFDTALQKVLGLRPLTRIRMSGKTDPQIVVEYLDQMGIEESDGMVDAVLDQVAADLAAAAAGGALARLGHACPGVGDLLPKLAADPDVVSTLLTGNIYPNAMLKVAAFGFDQWLRTGVGAYGSDDRDRNRLVPVAMAKVAAEDGVVPGPRHVWVIGDTPRDFECARAAGARCLLVGTGRYPIGDLAELGADAVFEDLTDTVAVLDLLLGSD